MSCVAKEVAQQRAKLRESESVSRPAPIVELEEVEPVGAGVLPGGGRINRSKTAHTPKQRRRTGHSTRSPKLWAHVARRKARDNWTPRKIAKYLGVPLDEVRDVLGS